jgi:hypothetical protein
MVASGMCRGPGGDPIFCQRLRCHGGQAYLYKDVLTPPPCYCRFLTYLALRSLSKTSAPKNIANLTTAMAGIPKHGDISFDGTQLSDKSQKQAFLILCRFHGRIHCLL